MTRRAVLGSAFVVWLVVTVLAGTGQAQEAAASVMEVGWWSRQPGATAPEGGFSVTDAPDGAVSVAALKIDVRAQRVTKASLVLGEGDGTGGAEIAAMQACPSPSDWQAASPGALSAAPKADCSKGVDLKRAGTLWQGDVTSLLSTSGVLSVSIVPKAGASAGLPVKAVWNVTISSISLESEGEGISEGSTIAPSLADDDSGGGSGSIVSGDFEVVTPPSVTSSFRPSTFVPTTPTPAAPLEPALNAPPQPAAAEAPAQGTGTFPRRIDAAPPGERDGRPWVRALLFLPLAALAGGGAVAGRRAAQSKGWVAVPGIT